MRRFTEGVVKKLGRSMWPPSPFAGEWPYRMWWRVEFVPKGEEVWPGKARVRRYVGKPSQGAVQELSDLVERFLRRAGYVKVDYRLFDKKGYFAQTNAILSPTQAKIVGIPGGGYARADRGPGMPLYKFLRDTIYNPTFWYYCPWDQGSRNALEVVNQGKTSAFRVTIEGKQHWVRLTRDWAERAWRDRFRVSWREFMRVHAEGIMVDRGGA